MRKIITVIAFALASLNYSGNAQSISGKAFYTAKSKVNVDFGNSQIPEDRKARMMQFMNDMSTNTFELAFNQNASLYSEEEKLEQGPQMHQGRKAMMAALFNQSSGEFYKNTEEATYVNKRDVYGKPFSIQDKLEQLNWTVTDEVKTIGQYTCFKATTVVKQYVMPEVPIGRGGNGDKKRPELKDLQQDTEVTAWFTLDIPVNQGPDKYFGLPGLILEVKSEHLVILCTRVEVATDKAISVAIPKGGKKVTQDEFDEVMKKKTEEVKEQMKNRRKGGFRSPH